MKSVPYHLSLDHFISDKVKVARNSALSIGYNIQLKPPAA